MHHSSGQVQREEGADSPKVAGPEGPAAADDRVVVLSAQEQARVGGTGPKNEPSAAMHTAGEEEGSLKGPGQGTSEGKAYRRALEQVGTRRQQGKVGGGAWIVGTKEGPPSVLSFGAPAGSGVQVPAAAVIKSLSH